MWPKDNKSDSSENSHESLRIQLQQEKNEQNDQAISTTLKYVPELDIQKSSSRSSSVADEPRSQVDSISGLSERHAWSMKEDDPSISSIKGDSISASMVDYDRKHRSQSTNQSRVVPVIDTDQDSSVNFFATSGSTGSLCKRTGQGSITGGQEAFNAIEESSPVPWSHEIPSRSSLAQTFGQAGMSSHGCTNQLDFDLDLEEPLQEACAYQSEPILLRGNGNLTLFGLSNSFSSDFPPTLVGRVSREEFERTMRRINLSLRDQQSINARLLLLGSLCCCCSLGLSLFWPSMALKRRSKTSLEKLLASENSRLYSALGLSWRLAEQRCYSNHAFVEYVLKIEFSPKINLYLPD